MGAIAAAHAQPPPAPPSAPAPALPEPDAPLEATPDDADTSPAPDAEPADAKAESEPEVEGFVMPAGQTTTPALTLMGYVDFGYANAGGNGTSYPRATRGCPRTTAWTPSRPP